MKRLETILTKVLGVAKKDIHDQMSPDQVPSWDSFNGLMIVSELEAVFKVKFTMEEVNAVRCVGDIRKALERHGIRLECD